MRRPGIIALSAIAAVVIVVSIAWFVVRSVALAATPADAMIVVVTRIYPVPGEPTMVLFSQRFGAAQAQRIYSTLRAEPDITGEVQSCPGISTTLPYYHYVLTFSHRGLVLGTATSDGVGCEDIIFNDHGAQTVYFWNNNGTSFWDVLHQVTSAPVPVYGPSGS
jgi:hypothetical protein